MEQTTDYTTDTSLTHPDTTLITEITARPETTLMVESITQAVPPNGGGGITNDTGKAIGSLLACMLVVIVLLYIFGGRR